MAGSFITMGNEEAYQLMSLISSLASIFVLAPLVNLWWTRHYMIRKGMLNEEEVKDPW
jgi:hypothetical protein